MLRNFQNSWLIYKCLALHSHPMRSMNGACAQKCNFATISKFFKYPKNSLNFSGKSYSNDIEFRCLVGGMQRQNFTTSTTNRQESKGILNDPSLAYLKGDKVYANGSNQILPSTAARTWHPQGAVRLPSDYSDKWPDLTPVSIPTFLLECVDNYPNLPAMSIKRDGKWQTWTYEQYYQDVRTCARAFIRHGFDRLHSVCILGSNSPEWLISNFAAILAGGFSVGVYATNSVKAVEHCARDSNACIFIVENDEQAAKVLQFRHNISHLNTIVQWTGIPKHDGVLNWSQFMKFGEQQSDSELRERTRYIAVNQCCSIIYTSGTTGKPKGVMLSHDSLTWMAQVSSRWAGFEEPHGGFQEVILSFLPLSHIAAQMADIYSSLAVNAHVVFADADSLKSSLLQNMKDVKPTKFFAVPRVWEKMYEKLTEVEQNTTGIRRKILMWAKKEAFQYNMKRMKNPDEPEPMSFKIANKMILSKIRFAMGLSRCNLFVSGAASLSPAIIDYFLTLNIPIVQGYGLSETSGPHSLGTTRWYRFRSSGQNMPGCQSLILNPNSKGEGELSMTGRHIAMGYLNRQTQTEEAFDSNGGFRSGDIASVDEDGFVFITARLKEIIVTSAGENVAPLEIEDKIKIAIPAVGFAVVIGDQRKYLTVLLTIKCEVDPNTQLPLDKLTPSSKQWIERNGKCNVNTLSDVLREINKENNQHLQDALKNGMDAVNSTATSRAQKIQKWIILPKDFSMPSGELGPTLKLKRSYVCSKYDKYIQMLYRDNHVKK